MSKSRISTIQQKIGIKLKEVNSAMIGINHLGNLGNEDTEIVLQDMSDLTKNLMLYVNSIIVEHKENVKQYNEWLKDS